MNLFQNLQLNTYKNERRHIATRSKKGQCSDKYEFCINRERRIDMSYCYLTGQSNNFIRRTSENGKVSALLTR